MARINVENFTGTFGTLDDYNSVILKRKYTVKELRKEYRKMRKEAKKRIKQIKEVGYGDSQIIENKEYLDKNPSNLSKRELASFLSYTASFLNSDLSTVEGQERQRQGVIETFRDMGYTAIDAKNFDEFGKFMKRMHTYIKNKVISSDVVVDLYNTAKEQNISVRNIERNYEWYAENLDDIKELELNPDRKRKYTATELKKILARDMTRG